MAGEKYFRIPPSRTPYAFTSSSPVSFEEAKRVCPVCGSTDIIRNNDTGELVCAKCGTVVDVLSDDILSAELNVHFGKEGNYIKDHARATAGGYAGTFFFKNDKPARTHDEIEILQGEIMRHMMTIANLFGIADNVERKLSNMSRAVASLILKYMKLPDNYLSKARLASYLAVHSMHYSYMIADNVYVVQMGYTPPTDSVIRKIMARKLLKGELVGMSHLAKLLFLKKKLIDLLATKQNFVDNLPIDMRVTLAYSASHPVNSGRMAEDEDIMYINPAVIDSMMSIAEEVPQIYVERKSFQLALYIHKLLYRAVIHIDKAVVHGMVAPPAISSKVNKRDKIRAAAVIIAALKEAYRKGKYLDVVMIASPMLLYIYDMYRSSSKFKHFYTKLHEVTSKIITKVYEQYGEAIFQAALDKLDPQHNQGLIIIIETIRKRLKNEGKLTTDTVKAVARNYTNARRV
ncbi:MAG: TFIIB-type zinc ribbon-containing protein [Thermococcus sp.]